MRTVRSPAPSPAPCTARPGCRRTGPARWCRPASSARAPMSFWRPRCRGSPRTRRGGRGTPHSAAVWARLLVGGARRCGAPRRALLRLGAVAGARAARAPAGAPVPRPRAPRHPVPPALLARRGMVHAGRRAGLRGAVLPRAPAAAAARAAHARRGRGRQPQLAAPDPAPRGRPRARQRLPAAPPAAVARDLRTGLTPVPEPLPHPARQPRLRAAPRQLVRAEPPDRGLRRDLRGVAEARLALARRLRRLGGVLQARVRRCADARGAGRSAARAFAPDRRLAGRRHAHARRALPRDAPPVLAADPPRGGRAARAGVHARARPRTAEGGDAAQAPAAAPARAHRRAHRLQRLPRAPGHAERDPPRDRARAVRRRRPAARNAELRVADAEAGARL